MQFTNLAILLCLSTCAFAQTGPLIDDPALNQLLTTVEQQKPAAEKPLDETRAECIYYLNAILDYVVYDEQQSPFLLFTSIRSNWASYKLFPNILRRDDDGWKRIPVPDTRDAWTHIHVSDDLQHIFVAMDNVPESPGWMVKVLLSDDGGKGWRYADGFRKYSYFQIIRYFKMDGSGVGTAVQYNDGDTDGYDRVGYFVRYTGDWGATWSDQVYQQVFDPAGFIDVYDGFRQFRDGRTPLKELELSAFDHCAEDNPD